MKEIQFLNVIKKALSDSSYLGDDCAFLAPEIIGTNGIYVTQDSLVEDVHFSLVTITPFQLGKKSVNVNLSDLAAMSAKPLFITISLSLPKSCDEEFVEQFYKGVNEACEKYGVKVAGGDLTGSDKVFVSVCALGSKYQPYKVSRSCAKEGDVVVITGFHGDSAGGLKVLCSGNENANSKNLIAAHLDPIARVEESKLLAQNITSDFAMMDTSDGLADALFKLAKESNVSFEIDFDTVPVSDELKNTFPDSYKELVLWGGEDYELLFCVNEETFSKLDKTKFFKIGVVKKPEKESCVKIKDGNQLFVIDEKTFNQKSFNHFGIEK